ncbi:facilitated trehalose transporter Tret1-like isoform X1 [Macrosteles quadrilineatus]|uniref:facilitated trehalose transporter Tret1-like isoform X1 n=2 Tax=Macrosteles quadrilineatus TaxID=74068 RepID=UPI0023E246EA|nr:facilitated trehalose transporter Tret1-like isoform X1 [Macrosteles quadrilineatus]
MELDSPHQDVMGPLGGSWGGGVFNQYRAALSGSMAYTLMGAATAWPSPVLIKMANHETPLILDVNQISWMISMMFLGHVTSPIPTGYLMDIFGRKKTCICLSILPFISWLLILYADTPAHLYIARFAAGLWIGVTTTIMPIYVSEIAGPKLRSSLTTINNLLLNFGVLFVYVIGPYVSYDWLAIACIFLTLFYFCLFLQMPESPYYYMKHNQKEKAFQVLCWLRQGEPKQSIESEIKRVEVALDEQKEQKGTLGDILYDKANRKAFIIAITYAILKRSSGSGVLQAYASITLPKVTFGVLDPDSCVIIIGVIGLLSSIASTGLMVKYHRRTLLTISCGGCAIASAVVMVWFYYNNNYSTLNSKYSDIVFLSFALYYSVFNFGLGPIGTSIKGEIFSPNVKALSSSLTTLVVALSGFLINKYYLLIAHSVGMYMNFFIFTLSCVLAILFSWTYVPDTHNRTLEEIREILKYGKKFRLYSNGR